MEKGNPSGSGRLYFEKRELTAIFTLEKTMALVKEEG